MSSLKQQFSAPIEKFSVGLSGLPAFQAFCGVGSAVLALPKVIDSYSDETDSFPRSIVALEDYQSDISSEDGWDSRIMLSLLLETVQPASMATAKRRDVLKWFRGQCETIVDELKAKAEQRNWLAIETIETAVTPRFRDEDRNGGAIVLVCVLAIHLKT